MKINLRIKKANRENIPISTKIPNTARVLIKERITVII